MLDIISITPKFQVTTLTVVHNGELHQFLNQGSLNSVAMRLEVCKWYNYQFANDENNCANVFESTIEEILEDIHYVSITKEL